VDPTNPYQSPNADSRPATESLDVTKSRPAGAFFGDVLIAAISCQFPVALVMLIVDGPTGAAQQMSRSDMVALFIGAAFVYVTLRSCLLIPRFGQSRARLALSAMFAFPVSWLAGVPSPGWSGVVVAVYMGGLGVCVEFIMAILTGGRRRSAN